MNKYVPAPGGFRLRCKVDGCSLSRRQNGLCGKHFRRYIRSGDPLGPLRTEVKSTCSVDGCYSDSKSKGLCSKHYRRMQRHGDPLLGRAFNGDRLDFIFKVAVPFTGEECLTWPFSAMPNGYVSQFVGGKQFLAHRMVCEAVKGPPPSSRHVAAHSCGNGHKGCISPKHLRWATPSENAKDKLIHGTHNRGESNPVAKLKEADVIVIKSLLGIQTRREIAARYGVSIGAIQNIANGANWAWLSGVPVRGEHFESTKTTDADAIFSGLQPFTKADRGEKRLERGQKA